MVESSPVKKTCELRGIMESMTRGIAQYPNHLLQFVTRYVSVLLPLINRLRKLHQQGKPESWRLHASQGMDPVSSNCGFVLELQYDFTYLCPLGPNRSTMINEVVKCDVKCARLICRNILKRDVKMSVCSLRSRHSVSVSSVWTKSSRAVLSFSTGLKK
jgi:hypothetical protein